MKKKADFQTGNIVLVSIAHLLHDIYSSFLAPLLPLIIDKLSISYSLAGLLTVFQRIPSLLNPFIGLIADRLSVRLFIIIGPLFTTIAMSLLGVADHYIVVAILLLFAGLGSTLFHVPSPVMIKNISGAKVGRGMSFYMLGGELARTLGPISILGAVSIWGFEGTYKLIPFGVAVSIFLHFRLKKLDISSNKEQNLDQISIKKSIKGALPTLTMTSGVLFCRSFMKGSLTAFLPTYLTYKGESLWYAGASLSLLQFSGAVGTFLMGNISDNIGRINTLYISIILTPILMLMFIFIEGYFSLIILLILGFLLFAPGPVILAMIQEIESPRPSLINGIFMTLNFSIGALAIVLVGAYSDLFGMEITFITVTFIALLAIPFVYIINKRNINKKR